MRAYPVDMTSNTLGGVLLRFPDVPEAVSCGRSAQEALDGARPVLEAVLGGYIAEGRDLPEPSTIDGAPLISTDRFEPGRWRPII